MKQTITLNGPMVVVQPLNSTSIGLLANDLNPKVNEMIPQDKHNKALALQAEYYQQQRLTLNLCWGFVLVLAILCFAWP